MKPGMAAYLRRAQNILRLVDQSYSAAVVNLDGDEIGTWGSIEAAWHVRGEGILLCLRLPNRREYYRVASIHASGSFVEVLIKGSPGTPPKLLQVKPEGSSAPTARPGLDLRFRPAISAWIRGRFPQCDVQWLACRSDRRYSLSGSYNRVLVRFRDRLLPILVVPAAEAADLPDGALCQLLLWLISLQRRVKIHRQTAACIMLPSGDGDVVRHRAGHLNPELLAVEVLEYDLTDSGSLQVSRGQASRTPLENRDFRWPLLGPFRWSPQLQRVLELAPAFITRYPRFHEFDSLRILGLEFARAEGENREIILFGVGKEKVELTQENFDLLRMLVDEILYYRRADSPDVYHPWYRLQAERWLESLVLESGTLLFPELIPEAVYSQIPVYLGKEAGRVDVLGMDLQGRLVVVELKVVEDPNLPIQALDYWGRVVQHNLNGDFEKRGYFPGFCLKRDSPRIYLVSPVFAFHDSTERLLEFFDPAIEIWKIGINEDWRSGVKILNRVRLRCGESTTG